MSNQPQVQSNNDGEQRAVLKETVNYLSEGSWHASPRIFARVVQTKDTCACGPTDVLSFPIAKKEDRKLTEASVGDLQVPHIYPKVVCRNEVLSVTVRVYRIHVVCMGIRIHSSEACRDRRACYRNLWQGQRFPVSPDPFPGRVRYGRRDFLHLLLANLP